MQQTDLQLSLGQDFALTRHTRLLIRVITYILKWKCFMNHDAMSFLSG